MLVLVLPPAAWTPTEAGGRFFCFLSWKITVQMFSPQSESRKCRANSFAEKIHLPQSYGAGAPCAIEMAPCIA
ncbi:MAG TPA: hypothetical protein DCZ10_11705 [Pelotomaculum sp.]|nr:hypothetical protein [Pelotomaculum sp.]